MNAGMHTHAHATPDEAPGGSRGPRDRESLVSGLAVAAVAVAAVLAAVMHGPTGARTDAPRVSFAAAGQAPQRHAPAPCAECGVVEAVVPVRPAADDADSAWQMRIRMDDGTVRTVEQRGALAAGSRVMVAGGFIRVLSNRPGQG